MSNVIKKILGSLLCFALVLPLGVLLTACGHNHEFNSTYETNATHHWRICTVEDDCDITEEYEAHSFDAWKVRTAVTCTQNGLEYRTCKCGYEETKDIVAVGHIAGAEYSNDSTHHWYDCTSANCDYDLDKNEHTWGEWIDVNPATCTSQGARSKFCTVCEYSVSENTSMAAHVASNKFEYDETYHWNPCKNVFCSEKVNKTEHEYQNGICKDCHYGAVASIGDTYFTSFADAIASIQDKSTLTTIVLFDDVTAQAVRVESGHNIVFDLNGHTYTVTEPAVGSPGTTTGGFQLLKGSNITFKNGTITHATSYTVEQDNKDVQILIQNYANLTLENVTLDAHSKLAGAVRGTCLYALSNNNATTLLKGNTNIIADQTRENGSGGVAFDVWYTNSYANGLTVIFDSSFNGSVDGKIEYGARSNTTEAEWEEKAVLTIAGGTFTAEEFVFTNNVDQANIIITGGTFKFNVSEYIDADNYKCTEDGLGNWSVEPR